MPRLFRKTGTKRPASGNGKSSAKQKNRPFGRKIKPWIASRDSRTPGFAHSVVPKSKRSLFRAFSMLSICVLLFATLGLFFYGDMVIYTSSIIQDEGYNSEGGTPILDPSEEYFEPEDETELSSATEGESEAEETTAEFSWERTTNTAPNEDGTFTLTVYGWGHGVGMSQEGANILAKKGWSYEQILKYYYSGITISTCDVSEEVMTMTNNRTGEEVSGSVLEVVSQIIEAEVSSGAHMETLKAQAVAAYGYYKYGGRSLPMKPANERAVRAAQAVLGKYCSYKGRVAQTVFFALAAGPTTSSDKAWGGDRIPYLSGGAEPPEEENRLNGYRTTLTYTAKEMKKLIKKRLGINVQGDPNTWIAILSHDACVDPEVGYVSLVQVGAKKMTGPQFRNRLFGTKMRSQCFTVEYK